MTRPEAFTRIAGVIQDILRELDESIASPVKGGAIGEAHAANALAIDLETLLFLIEKTAEG